MINSIKTDNASWISHLVFELISFISVLSDIWKDAYSCINIKTIIKPIKTKSLLFDFPGCSLLDLWMNYA